MKIYDTHCHFNSEPLLSQSNNIVETCKSKQMLINDVGTSVESSKKCIDNSNKYDICYAIVGVHPSEINDADLDILEIEKLLKNKKVVAIGETGFDFHFTPFDKAKQTKSFINHIKLANKHNLPLVVHTRDAKDETYEILKNNISNNQKILIHCFSGSKEELQNYLSLGCYFSISGIITFKKSIELREIVKLIPIDKIMIETDSPYLAPVPYRGTTNMPYYVEEVLKTLSSIFNVNIDELSQKIFENSIKFFNIPLNTH